MPLGAVAQHFVQEPANLFFRKGHKARWAFATAFALAHLGVIVVPNAVGPPARLGGDPVENGL